MCVSMVGEEDGESSRRGYQDVLVGECGLVKKKKKKCGLAHTSILIHQVANSPRLFAQAVESAAVIFLSIYIETADSLCGDGSQFICGLVS